MQTTHYLVLAQGWQADALASANPQPATGEPGWRALAARLGYPGDAFAGLLAAALEGPDHRKGPAVRIAVVTDNGVAIVVAVILPEAIEAPGAPSALERYREAGLRLGAEGSGGVIWCDMPESEGPYSSGSLLDALWIGLRLGAQKPAASMGEEEPVFACGWVPSAAAKAKVKALGWVRELVEQPPNLLGPEEFANAIACFAASHGAGVEVDVWPADALAERGFGALVAVGGGSVRPPVAVNMRWAVGEGGSGRLLGVVGKGITFDSGGVNIKKDPNELAWMKSDMAAAASVAAAVVLASRCAAADTCNSNGSRVVEAVLPICDNVISGSSMRPGDVLTHPGGHTTEVVDTDCEGRLVIADGLSWLRTHGAAVLLDVGTLTDGGAGLRRTGLWSNDASLSAALAGFGEMAGDPLWPLPLPYGEEDTTSSRVARLRNAPLDRPDMGRHAAAYLAAIAEDTRWAHFDIGGTAYLETDFAGWPKGPTGASTAALAEAMLAWSQEKLQ